MKMFWQTILLFVVAFLLNALWEFWHAQFYLHYQGGSITSFILLRAALVDATIISAIALAIPRNQKYVVWSFVVGGGLVIAVVLEWWALATNRWAYSSTMPIVPFLHTGLTPTIQLALLGIIAWKFARIFSSDNTS